MTVSRILDGLERSEATGSDADQIARLGFLEWVFTQPDAVTSKEVTEALHDASVQKPTSAAARAFVDVLRAARHVSVLPVRRGGRQARHLH